MGEFLDAVRQTSSKVHTQRNIYEKNKNKMKREKKTQQYNGFIKYKRNMD